MMHSDVQAFLVVDRLYMTHYNAPEFPLDK